MTISGDFRARVLAGEFVAGCWLNLGSPVTAEMAGLAGFDWVLLDHEHGPGSEETILHQLQAASATPAVPLVRIATNDPARFKRVLDAGAHGVMVPYISTPAEAQAVVNAMRYQPRGIRGVAKLTRASGFGARFDEYYTHAHEWLVTIPQVETEEAVQNAAEIAAIDGVDVLFIGPMDLSVSLGVPGDYLHPRCQDAWAHVASAARAAGKAAGILLFDPAHVTICRRLGFTFIALGSDGGAVLAGMHKSIDVLRASP